MRPKILTFALFLALIDLIGSACNRQLVRGTNIGSDFEGTAQKAMDALSAEDFKSLSHYLDKENLHFVKRWWNSNDTGIIADLDEMTGMTEDTRRTTLFLSSLNTMQWDEAYASFIPDEYATDRFRAILGQFSAFLQESREDFQGERYLHDGLDHWEVRCIQDCVEGKLASNVYWYIYFHQTAAGWRIHRMEWAIH